MDLTGDLVDISATDEWRRLAEHYAALRNRHLRDLFAEDPEPRQPDDAVGRRTSSSTSPSTG